jgi:hypothetical protein
VPPRSLAPGDGRERRRHLPDAEARSAGPGAEWRWLVRRDLVDELGASGVRVNAVRPGLVATDLTVALTAIPAIRDDYLAQMPLHRVGTTEDVAALCRFLVGPESSWITGQVIGADGGHSLRRGPDFSSILEGQWGKDGLRGVVGEG